ncbi:uncharacterized protein [Panulirus ornatus]|uniref:uncharacterized protein n=1 Tax=Panulirus ornatus TaxID=150431 RepID=UPI003A85E381
MFQLRVRTGMFQLRVRTGMFQLRTENRNASAQGKNRNVPAQTENRNASAQGKNRNVPAQSENRNVPAQGENRNVPAQTENRNASAQGKNRNVPAQTENRNASAQGKNRNVPAQSENRNVPAQSENRNVPAQSENRNVPAQSENRNVPAQSENRNASAQGKKNIRTAAQDGSRAPPVRESGMKGNPAKESDTCKADNNFRRGKRWLEFLEIPTEEREFVQKETPSLEDEFGIKIKFPARRNYIILQGGRQGVTQACLKLQRLVDLSQPSGVDLVAEVNNTSSRVRPSRIWQCGNVLKMVNIDPSAHGLLIGRAGRTVHGISRKYCVEIYVPRKAEEYKAIDILGRKEDVEMAEREVLRVTRQSTSRSSRMYDVFERRSKEFYERTNWWQGSNAMSGDATEGVKSGDVCVVAEEAKSENVWDVAEEMESEAARDVAEEVESEAVDDVAEEVESEAVDDVAEELESEYVDEPYHAWMNPNMAFLYSITKIYPNVGVSTTSVYHDGPSIIAVTNHKRASMAVNYYGQTMVSHQTQSSMALYQNGKPSMAVSHGSSSMAMSQNGKPSMAVSHHIQSSRTMSHNGQPSMGISHHRQSSMAMSHNGQSSMAISQQRQSSMAMSHNGQSSMAISHHEQSSRTTSHYGQSYWGRIW